MVLSAGENSGHNYFRTPVLVSLCDLIIVTTQRFSDSQLSYVIGADMKNCEFFVEDQFLLILQEPWINVNTWETGHFTVPYLVNVLGNRLRNYLDPDGSCF